MRERVWVSSSSQKAYIYKLGVPQALVFGVSNAAACCITEGSPSQEDNVDAAGTGPGAGVRR